ncbi:MAG: DUF6790 family protein [Acetobacteraceae bacterium]
MTLASWPTLTLTANIDSFYNPVRRHSSLDFVSPIQKRSPLFRSKSTSVFLLGDAVGHVRQIMVAGNFAPGNAGLPFVMDILCPLLAIVLLILARRPVPSRLVA